MSQNDNLPKPRIRFGRYGQAIEFKLDQLLAGPAIDYTDEKYKALLDDLQANILKRHKKKNTDYYFLHFHTAERLEAFLANLSGHITTAKEQLEGQDDYNLNVYLTYPGYQLLDLPKGLIPKESAFSMGMHQRTKLPLDHLDFNDSQSIHAIVLIAYDEKWPNNKEVNALVSQKASNGFDVLYKQSGQLENPLSEAFQFQDGISNPRFFPGAFSSEKTTNHAVRAEELSPMQIVLRHDNTGDQGFSCGSYGVFAKFAIHEKAIQSVVKTLEKELGVDEELAKAHVLGRFMDGTPLSLSNKQSAFPTNHFNYRELINSEVEMKKAKNDNDGSRCPFHTHVRKANPRQKGDESRRIVRRGLFFNESEEQGLLFVSFQSSLENQFEYILNSWMLSELMQVDEDYAKLVNTNKDILFSQAGEEYTFPKKWNGKDTDGTERIKVTMPDTMITFKGGIYFFAPSVSFFKKLNFSKKRVLSSSRSPDQEPKQFSFLPGTEVQIHADRKEAKAEYNFIEGTVVAFSPKK